MKHIQKRGQATLHASLIGALLVGGFTSGCFASTQCSPVSQEKLQATEKFVRDHLPKAYEIESGTRDCDDDGDGYVNFAMDGSVMEVREEFLKDPACTLDNEDPADPGVACVTDTGTVYVFFTPDTTEDTARGEIGVR
jgi:hypothetical protein